MDKLDQMDDEPAEHDDGRSDRSNVPDHTHRTPISPPSEAGLVTDKQVFATQSGEPMYHDAVREARVKELKDFARPQRL